MTTRPERRPLWNPILCAATLVLGGIAIDQGYYDLFVFVPRIHFPRVTITMTDFGVPIASAALNVPTLCEVVIFLGGGVAVYGGLRELWRWWTRSSVGRVRFWVIQAFGLGAAVLAWLVYAVDFLTNAFQGVG